MNKAQTTLNIRGKIKMQKTVMIQEEILAAASRLIAERGFRAVTVDDISAEMGFTKSVIYYYLKNKNEILWRIFEKIDETYANGLDEALSLDADPTELLARVVKQHCLNVLLHRDWSTIYNRDENELAEDQQKIVDDNKRRYNRRVQELYAKGVKAGKFRDTPPVIAVSCIIGACNWPYVWFKPTGKLNANQIADSYAELLIKGVVI
jgi:AcrR family transcriptional regulator